MEITKMPDETLHSALADLRRSARTYDGLLEGIDSLLSRFPEQTRILTYDERAAFDALEEVERENPERWVKVILATIRRLSRFPETGTNQLTLAMELERWLNRRMTLGPKAESFGEEARRIFSLGVVPETGDGWVRESVRWFAGQMEARLKQNDHKGGWRDANREFLIESARENIRQLTRGGIGDEAERRRILAAADAANFCMMLADMARTDLEDKP